MQSNKQTEADAKLWDALAAFRGAMVDQMQGDLAAMPGLQLSLPQSMALNMVAQAGPQTVAELQARLHRSQATTSHLVTQLELRGLVARAEDPADARRTRVQLTREGKALIGRLEKARKRAFSGLLGRLPVELRNRLSAALSETVAVLSKSKTRRQS
ncbi:MAG: MarR family transcriptional regulator [Archangium sp.]|nr:MarR family transcriptional regulator [Archangium sp.]